MRMKIAQHCFKGDHNKKIFNTKQLLYAQQQIYMIITRMTTFAAKSTALDSYSKQVSPTVGPSKIVRISIGTVTIDKNITSNSVLIWHNIGPTNSNRAGGNGRCKQGQLQELQIHKSSQNLHTTPATQQNIIHDKKDKSKCKKTYIRPHTETKRTTRQYGTEQGSLKAKDR